MNGSIDWPTGYTLSLASPICGALTETPGNWGIDYSVSLSPMEAAQSVTCHFVVARDSNAASDLNLWLASTPDDFNPNNDAVAFAIGSIIDVSVDLTPKWFFIDGDGIGHESELLYVANHGPSDVDAFEIGACEDNYFPGFTLDGEFAGGCGPSDYGPLCFDDGLGFMMPPLASGAEFRCEIRLTSFEPYQDPLGFEIRTDILPNPAMHGGELLDTDAQDNSVVLLLEPMSTIFANGFGP